MKLEARSRLIASGSATKYFDPKWISELRVPDYKARSKLISMTPGDFLKMAEPFEGGRPNEQKLKDLRKLIDSGTKLNRLPFLLFASTNNPRNMQVDGHEGRHRAWLFLHEYGCTHMPVEFRGPIRWSEQGSEEKFDYYENWPVTLIGQSHNHMPFPVKREDSMKPFEG